MKVRLLQTTGDGQFSEVMWEKPDPSATEIEVKSVMTGVCRSDIDMMLGKFNKLPAEMQGHEGLGIVTNVGANVTTAKIGDYVATRGEPSYADYYNCRSGEFVVVPELAPKYILEPVACGINCVFPEIGKCESVLILGSGFLAWIAYNTIRASYNRIPVDVLGSSNTHIWHNTLIQSTNKEYDCVVDLSGKYRLGMDIGLKNNALIIDAVGKPVSNDESQVLLWKACKTLRPSPRTRGFIDCMYAAKTMIETGQLDVDKFWTKCYNRDTEWQQAFEDGNQRLNNYSRGYIKWP